jgi:transcriptional regulator with XRE-family HTH domain
MLVMTPPISFHAAGLGAELVRLRTDAHLSQRALARISGVSNTAISALETGEAPAPHPSMLSKLAQGLATSGLGAIDDDAAAEKYLRLMRAAGYVPDEESEPATDGIEAELRAMFQPDEAPLVAELLQKLARHDARRRRFLLGTMKPLVLDFPDTDR